MVDRLIKFVTRLLNSIFGEMENEVCPQLRLQGSAIIMLSEATPTETILYTMYILQNLVGNAEEKPVHMG